MMSGGTVSRRTWAACITAGSRTPEPGSRPGSVDSEFKAADLPRGIPPRLWVDSRSAFGFDLTLAPQSPHGLPRRLLRAVGRAVGIIAYPLLNAKEISVHGRREHQPFHHKGLQRSGGLLPRVRDRFVAFWPQRLEKEPRSPRVARVESRL